jgi:hypothetical protein
LKFKCYLKNYPHGRPIRWLITAKFIGLNLCKLNLSIFRSGTTIADARFMGGSMQKWLILAYIISVLALSGMARAAESSVLIDTFKFNNNLLSLSISGSVLGDCGTGISSEIIDAQATEELPILLIEINNNSLNCQIKNDSINRFDLTLDLRSLGVKASSSYYLMFNNLFRDNSDPVTLVNIPKGISRNSPETVQIRGILKRDDNGKFYLDVDGALYSVNSLISLENYLNNKVIIDALKFIYQVQPGFDVNSHRPLRENSLNQALDGVYILGISTI